MSALRDTTPGDLIARQREEAELAAQRAADALARRTETAAAAFARVARLVDRREMDGPLIVALEEAKEATAIAADAARVAVAARARADRARNL